MKRRCRWVFVVLVLGGSASLAADLPTSPTTLELRKEESQLLELTNKERRKKDLLPFRPNSRLCLVARAHAENMARQGRMEHTLDGKTPLDRLADAGYRFAKGGENLASGEANLSLRDVMKAWMESKNNRENILFAEFIETGIGLARDKSGQVYYALVFAKPRSDD